MERYRKNAWVLYLIIWLPLLAYLRLALSIRCVLADDAYRRSIIVHFMLHVMKYTKYTAFFVHA